MGAISHEQFERILERAHDPRRRTYMAGIEADAQPMDFDRLKEDMRNHGAPAAQGLVALADMLGPLIGKLGGGAIAMGPGGPMRIGGAPASRDLGHPPSAALITTVEQQIGRALPDELHQLYAVGDGGFGPGKGLFPLLELGRRYRDHIAGPFGPLGQKWPANLLPLFDEDPVIACLDLDSGAIVAWDPEEIDDEESEEDWLRSFRQEYASLGDCMEAWLASPTFEEQMPLP